MVWQIVVGFLIIFLGILWHQRFTKFAKLINKIPGPPATFFFGHTFQILNTPENVWKFFQECNKKYPIYKVTNGFLTSVELVSPDDIEILLSSKDNIKKSIIYEYLQVWLGTGLLTSTGKKWQYRRKLLTPAFHFGILQQFSKVMIKKVDWLIQKLEEECKKKETSIEPFIGEFTLRTICETAMGTRFEDDNKQTKDYVSAIYRMGQLIIERIQRPWLFLRFVYYFSDLRIKEMTLTDTLHHFTTEVIENRKIDFKDFDQSDIDLDNESFVPKKRLALLDLLLSMKYRGANIDDEGIREEVDTFTFEGHDTTSSGIQFALFLLAHHPDIQEKIVVEIRQIMGNVNQQFAFADIQKMKYLEMVIKECLRMYPSVPIIARKLTTEMRTASNYVIPANTVTHVHIYGVHHNPLLYPNPEKFDPERFSPENCRGRHPFAYIPFSAGPRNCIGQRFALLELKIAIASIIRTFKLIPVNTEANIEIMTHLVLKSFKKILIKFEKRATQ